MVVSLFVVLYVFVTSRAQYKHEVHSSSSSGGPNTRKIQYSFARNWERSELKNGRLGMMNGIDGRQNGMKFSKDCWKPSKAREDMGERGPRHPLPTPVRPNLK